MTADSATDEKVEQMLSEKARTAADAKNTIIFSLAGSNANTYFTY